MLSSRLQFQNVLQISMFICLLRSQSIKVFFLFFFTSIVLVHVNLHLSCSSIAGVTADLDPLRIWTPRSKSASGYGPPFADLNPLPNFPFKHHTWSLILFASFFVDVLFNHNTTFLNKGKKKNQPFRSNSTAFSTASRTVYARIRCEQTNEFELLKFLQ